jgi:hypothetical protein
MCLQLLQREPRKFVNVLWLFYFGFSFLLKAINELCHLDAEDSKMVRDAVEEMASSYGLRVLAVARAEFLIDDDQCTFSCSSFCHDFFIGLFYFICRLNVKFFQCSGRFGSKEEESRHATHPFVVHRPRGDALVRLPLRRSGRFQGPHPS